MPGTFGWQETVFSFNRHSARHGLREKAEIIFFYLGEEKEARGD